MNLSLANDKEFIQKLTGIILNNLGDENFGVEELVRGSGLSHTIVRHRLRTIERKTISQFINEIRLRKAMDLLKEGAAVSSDIAYKVGFGSPSYFNKCFRDYFGFTPGDVKKSVFDAAHASPEEKQLPFQKKPAGNKMIILVVIAAVILIIALVLIYPEIFINNFKGSKNAVPEKSIAVLPFINDSPDTNNVYFINGLMESILDNLSKIKELEVRPRTSVEKYRNNRTKTIPQIGRELDVSYILEGSGQKYGDEVMLSIQLIETNSDKHIFSRQYTRIWKDLFSLQSEIARDVASRINVVVTLEERELIDKLPTNNPAAMNMFLRGLELYHIASLEWDKEMEGRAADYFMRAILLDSLFSDPYVMIGWTLIDKNRDSALYLAEKALHFDEKNPKGYGLLGTVYFLNGNETEAEKAFKLALTYNPNYTSAYHFLGELYFKQGNYTGAAENLIKTLPFADNSIRDRNNLFNFCSILYRMGFYKTGHKYIDKLYEQTNDSTYYHWANISRELDLGNYTSVAEEAYKAFRCDSVKSANIFYIANSFLFIRNYNEAYRLMQQCVANKRDQGFNVITNGRARLGFIYKIFGRNEDADFQFELSVRQKRKILDLNQPYSSCRAHFDLVMVYSAMGDKTKALENLRQARNCHIKIALPLITELKIHPIYDSIREEPEFVEFVKESEVNFLAEREKVKKLLQEEGILADP